MTISPKATLKTYFETGDYPTQGNYSDLIDSFLGLNESASQTVAGAVAFGDAVNVSGVMTAGSMSVTSNLAVNGSLDVVGNAIVSANLGVTGAFTVSGVATLAAGGTSITASAGTNTTGIATNAFAINEHKTKIVNATYNTATATGNASYTGAGFAPRGFRAYMGVAGDTSTRMSIGGYDGSTSFCLYYDVGAAKFGATTVYCIVVNDANGATQALGIISSLDADGCTIQWTKVGSPTGTVNLTFEFYR